MFFTRDVLLPKLVQHYNRNERHISLMSSLVLSPLSASTPLALFSVLDRLILAGLTHLFAVSQLLNI
ncbi:MAG: hypothetical protein RL368_2032 [Pseudomonadota bacterium]|jgi:hypothetical protein